MYSLAYDDMTALMFTLCWQVLRVDCATGHPRGWTDATSCVVVEVTTHRRRPFEKDVTASSTGVATLTVRFVSRQSMSTPASKLMMGCTRC